jgi:dihydrofolate synthase/folylpolyglutamate synthase
LTGFKGRWQILSDKPTLIADVAHNEEGIKEVVSLIEHELFDRLHIVYGAVKDKDVWAILRLFPSRAFFYFCRASLPRAMPAEGIAAIADQMKLEYIIEPDVNRAIGLAKARAEETDLILVTGSNFIIGEINDL